MRFLADGPNIPDELLRARDEGRVVFFCGAGVSLGRAGLPDFHELTSRVIKYLRATEDSPAVKRFTLPSRIAENSDGNIELSELSGIVSSDQIFGDLYREFPPDEVERAVAQALHIEGSVDVSAHEIIKKLARSPSGRLRLITTNFDRLFETDEKEKIWSYPLLPDLTQEGAPDGIVYLHGKISDDGQSAHPPGFILSSPEFGRAYMSDGRATRFIKELIKRFVVVFIGYSADDPPVRYLLEALGAGSDSGRLYAFQAGDQKIVEGQWASKGVTAISYSAEDKHKALWNSLEAWAERADDPKAWAQSIIDLARTSPSKLLPHQRGWVTHVVSTREGSKLFSQADPPPLAEWLYVFDPNKRYALPSRSHFDRESILLDPFKFYGLDSDPHPPTLDEDDDFNRKRETPQMAWGAFNLNAEDQQNATPKNIASYAEFYTPGIAIMPERLFSLGRWVGKVAESPATLAWAVSQPKLNSEIRSQIEWHVEKLEDNDPHNSIAKQWRSLFEVWDTNVDYDTHDMRWYRFKKRSEKSEWSESTIREFERSSRPRLSVRGSYPLGSTAPNDDCTKPILILDVSYPDCTRDLKIPNLWLPRTLEVLRNNLLLADRMENAVGYLETYELVPIRRGDDPTVNRYRGNGDLSGLLQRYVRELRELLKIEPKAAWDEFLSWPTGDSLVFARLRCWALGEPNLVPDGERLDTLRLITNDMFWHSGNQRDLLTSLNAVWSNLNDSEKTAFEARLLEGPDEPSWIEDEKKIIDWQATKTLSYIGYLSEQGVEFGFDLDVVSEKLKAKAPSWKPIYSTSAADEMGSRGGTVSTQTEHRFLLTTSLKNLLDVASSQSGRTDDFLVESDPFLGLAKSRPVRALAALRVGSDAEKPRTEFWRTFFSHSVRKEDSPQISNFILAKISTIDDAILKPILYNLTWWLRESSAHHSEAYPDRLDKFVDRIISILKSDPDLNKSSIVRDSAGVDWSGNALNSSPGHLADVLMNDSRRGNSEKFGFPKGWSERVRHLLTLPGDGGALVMATLSRNLRYIHHHDEKLADYMISLAFGGNSDACKEAFWAGFERAGSTPNAKLYLKIKPHMLSRVNSRQSARGGAYDALGAYILGGWRSQAGSEESPLINDSELSKLILNGSDEFRRSVLHYIQDWTLRELGKDDPSKFLTHVRDFFDQVWPRQLSIRNPAVSKAIKDLLTRDVRLTDIFYEGAYPYLTPLENHVHLYFREDDDLVVKKPREMLKIIAAVLPADVGFWPYGLPQLLDRLVEAAPELADHADLQRMRSRLS